jgi:pimeloyl-ACP methyl ester carboxylesterase
MKFHSEPAPAGKPATVLWVMLPGAYMKPGDFIEAGFVQAVRDRGLPHDIALLEANLTEMADGSALRHLQEFLRAQAPQRNVRLLGISLGAHLAMACLARASQGTAQTAAAARVNGALLLAPYLGPRDIVAEMGAAVGLQEVPADSDIDREIWQWLRRRSPAQCELHLGYGSEDRFAAAHALMARSLPASHVDVQPGGHAWPVWTALWNRHLDRFHAR